MDAEREDLEAMAYWILNTEPVCPVCGSSLAGLKIFSHIEEVSDEELQSIAIPMIMNGMDIHLQQARSLRALWGMIKNMPRIAEAFGR